MDPRIWTVMHQGKFKIMSLTCTLEPALDIMRDSFFKDELVSQCCDVPNNPEAIKELVKLAEIAAKDGVSLVAIDTTNGSVASATFNKLVVNNNTTDETTFENHLKHCKHDSSKAVVQVMIDADEKLNLFEKYNIDCVLELMFVGTKPEYRKKGLATNLMKASVELGKLLLKGENVKLSMDNQPLPLSFVPKITTVLCTTIYTQNAASKLGFLNMGEFKYDELFYKGKSYDSQVGHIVKSCIMFALVL